MSDQGLAYDPNSGLYDPYYQLALQSQFLPEYSATRGWLEPDIGTYAANNNLQQDYWQNYLNPFMAGAAGGVDPKAFESTWDESGRPEAPDLAQLELYRSSGDPVMRAIIQGLSEGRPPYDVIATLKETGVLEPDQQIPQPDGSTKIVSDPRADALLAEATTIQQQIGAENAYNRSMETYQPKEVLSPLAQKFRDAGLPLPTETYTPDTINPDLQGMAQQSADDIALAEALKARTEMQRNRRGVERAGGEEDRDGPWGRALDRMSEIRGRMPEDRSGFSRIGDVTRGLLGVGRPEETDRSGWGRLIDTVNAYNGRGTEETRTGRSTAKQRMRAQSDWLNATQRAANSQLAEALARADANSASRIAQAQGRTPYLDAIARRAGG